MVRTTRKIPALVSTIALIAGCGSSTRAEVSGVVVDALTGRAIAGARVVAPDGSATRTDAEGRFTLSVGQSQVREIRASAAGREDARARIDVRVDQNASIVIQLVPEPEPAPRLADDQLIERLARDPDAVLRWIDDLELEEWRVRGVREPSSEPGSASIADASQRTTDCGGCDQAESVWGAREQWALGGMTLGASVLGQSVLGQSVLGSSALGQSRLGRQDEATHSGACASCHDAGVFAAAHGAAAGPGARPTGACSACHDESVGGALRAYEHAGLVAGEPTVALGSGAVCVDCHRVRDDAAGHAPQADVVLGRGARTLERDALGPPAHGAIADTCVACHAAPTRSADPTELTLGHTFEVRQTSGALAEGACSACHGRVAPESIARGDWDGDGVRGAIAEEHDRALARVRARLEARIRAARITATCGGRRQTATGFGEHHGAIVLFDVRQVMLGDCDADGVVDAGEHAVSIDALPEGALSRPVRDAAWDVMLLERDGSRGVHNPDFAFALLGAIESRL